MKNKTSKKKKNKKKISKFRKTLRTILLVIVALAIVYVVYFFGILAVWEPSTDLKETSTEPVIYENLTDMKDSMGDEYPYILRLEQLMTHRSNEEMDKHLLNVPGVEATTSLSKKHKKKMCTSMTPQGMVVCDEGIFISAYCHTHKHCSVIYYLSLKGELLETIVLDSTAHVGGLAYDENNRTLWVSEKIKRKPALGGIKIDKIENYSYSSGKPIEYDQLVELEDIKAASYLTYYEGSIYVGLFKNGDNGKVNRYDIDEEGVLSGKCKDSIKTDENIQGLYISDYYAVMSKSYGPSNSKVLIFSLVDDDENIGDIIAGEETALITYDDPPKLEQLGVYKDEAYFLYESSAFCYRQRGSANIDRVLSYELTDTDEWDDVVEAVQKLEKMKKTDNANISVNEDIFIQSLKALDITGLFKGKDSYDEEQFEEALNNLY